MKNVLRRLLVSFSNFVRLCEELIYVIIIDTFLIGGAAAPPYRGTGAVVRGAGGDDAILIFSYAC